MRRAKLYACRQVRCRNRNNDDLSKEISFKGVNFLCYLFCKCPEFWTIKKNRCFKKALKILTRTDSDIFLEHSAFLFLLNAAHANCFLLLMSYDFPRSRSSRLPRYLQFFQLWSDVLLMDAVFFCYAGLTVRFFWVFICQNFW